MSGGNANGVLWHRTVYGIYPNEPDTSLGE